MILNRKDKLTKLKVSSSTGFLQYNNGHLSDDMLIIEVSNIGTKRVVINTPYVILPGKKKLVFPNYQSNVTYPYTLEEGIGCKMWVDLKLLCESLKDEWYSGKIKILAAVDDVSGKKYISKRKHGINIG